MTLKDDPTLKTIPNPTTVEIASLIANVIDDPASRVAGYELKEYCKDGTEITYCFDFDKENALRLLSVSYGDVSDDSLAMVRFLGLRRTPN